MSSERNPWLGVELRHLAALSAVAREGSFRGAAEALGYVQSAVSQQVAYLEQVVGQRLVVRDRGAAPAALTPAGELLLDHFRRILASLGAAQADLEALGRTAGKTWRLGACESLAGGLLPEVVARLLDAGSAAPRLELTEAPAQELAAQIAGGSLDVALVSEPGPEDSFARQELFADPYLLLTPVAGRITIPNDAGELAELPLIDHVMMRPVEEWLCSLDTPPRYTVRCESRSALAALVAGGAGYAIVPTLALPALGNAENALRLDAILQPRPISVIWHADRLRPTWLDELVEVLSAGEQDDHRADEDDGDHREAE